MPSRRPSRRIAGCFSRTWPSSRETRCRRGSCGSRPSSFARGLIRWLVLRGLSISAPWSGFGLQRRSNPPIRRRRRSCLHPRIVCYDGHMASHARWEAHVVLARSTAEVVRHQLGERRHRGRRLFADRADVSRDCDRAVSLRWRPPGHTLTVVTDGRRAPIRRPSDTSTEYLSRFVARVLSPHREPAHRRCHRGVSSLAAGSRANWLGLTP